MDTGLFFLDENTTSINMPNAQDYNVLWASMIGFGLGMLMNGMYMVANYNQRRFNDIMDENESLKSAIDDLNETNEDLEFQIDRMTADAAASDNLIDSLKTEVTNLSNKVYTLDLEVAGLDSDNYALAAELSEVQSTVMRTRNINARSPSVVRKRMREEL